MHVAQPLREGVMQKGIHEGERKAKSEPAIIACNVDLPLNEMNALQATIGSGNQPSLMADYAGEPHQTNGDDGNCHTAMSPTVGW